MRTIRIALLVLLLLAIPAQALAVNAQYPTTQAFLRAMDQDGIKYTWRGVDENDVEWVRVVYDGDNTTDIAVNFLFEMTPMRMSIRVWDIIHYAKPDFYFVLEAVNKLNNDYRYFSFYADPTDDTVTASCDMPIDAGCAGEFCREMLSRAVNIVDDAYPELSKYDQGN